MADGSPNGLLFDNAMDLATLRLPVPGKEELKQMLRIACAAVNARGITSVQTDDYVAFPGLTPEAVNEAFRELEGIKNQMEALTQRMTASAPPTILKRYDELAARFESLGGYHTAVDTDKICNAVAMALKMVLGLACDPVAGLVEVPCVKRNVMGAMNAVAAADMAMAGIRSQIPVDEVIDAMGQVGRRLPVELRETALGGLAATPTGKAIMKRMRQNNPIKEE
jgi:L-serine dehydratase